MKRIKREHDEAVKKMTAQHQSKLKVRADQHTVWVLAETQAATGRSWVTDSMTGQWPLGFRPTMAVTFSLA